MRILKIITWLTGFSYIVLFANHFFNPQFEIGIKLMFFLHAALFTLFGVQEHQAGRRKLAAIPILLAAVSFIGLVLTFFQN
jgi:hypothetical protein